MQVYIMYSNTWTAIDQATCVCVCVKASPALFNSFDVFLVPIKSHWHIGIGNIGPIVAIHRLRKRLQHAMNIFFLLQNPWIVGGTWRIFPDLVASLIPVQLRCCSREEMLAPALRLQRFREARGWAELATETPAGTVRLWSREFVDS